MQRIVIDRRGDFELSWKALQFIAQRKGVSLVAYIDAPGEENSIARVDTYPDDFEPGYSSCTDLGALITVDQHEEFFRKLHLEENRLVFERDDPDLLEAVRALGDRVAMSRCELAIIEIPDDVQWEVCAEWNDRYGEFMGEYIEEKHRIWR